VRSIGKRNIEKVRELTKELMRKHTTPWGDTDFSNVEEEVVELLPTELWDTWEMADQEIRRIINDVIMESPSPKIVVGKQHTE